MYCPNCGQQQVSDEMRFCSRCGLALSGLGDWLAGNRVPLVRREESRIEPMSPRRKGIRRAGKLMFFSGVLFPIFLAISIGVDEGGPLAIPFILFFISLAMMLYARLFSAKHAPHNIHAAAQTTTLSSNPARGSLPPPTNMPIPAAGRQQVRTNELYQPPSVTENTTRLLDNEEQTNY
jgi:endogenous inhibitor of DNA gyrase (YacG/DUF329 family)